MKSGFALVLCCVVACSGSSPAGVPEPPSDATTTTTSPTEPPKSDAPHDDATTPTPGMTGSTTTGPGTTSTVATAKDCAAYATAYCSKSDQCNYLFSKIVGSACETRMAGICEAHLSSPGTGYTKAALNACTSAFTTLSCSEAFGEVAPAACAFKGTLPLDSDCAFDDQCASGACSATSTTCGKCAVPAKSSPTTTPKAELGETCDETGQTAPDCNTQFGLWCDGTTKKCAEIPTAAIGESCGYLSGLVVMCAAGGTCKPGTTGSGTCVTEKAIGDSCNGVTSSWECAFGTECFAGKCAYPTAALVCP